MDGYKGDTGGDPLLGVHGAPRLFPVHVGLLQLHQPRLVAGLAVCVGRRVVVSIHVEDVLRQLVDRRVPVPPLVLCQERVPLRGDAGRRGKTRGGAGRPRDGKGGGDGEAGRQGLKEAGTGSREENGRGGKGEN